MTIFIMFSIALGALLTASAAAQSLLADADCPLFGPEFPAPRNLSHSPAISTAIASFNSLLNDTAGATSNSSAYSASFFSLYDSDPLFQVHYTPPTPIGVANVDSNSIYRIGSVTKVLTVWTFLIEAGDAYFGDPITKYVPELKNTSKLAAGTVYDDIDNVRWEDVTLGDLAGQTAGIARDVTGADLSVEYPASFFTNVGAPILNSTEIPTCGADYTQPPCTRGQFFHYLLLQHPAFPTAHSPAYSNIAYLILSYALEAITGKDFATMIQSDILTPLNLTHSSYITPNSTANGVIPTGNTTTSGWSEDIGVDNPGGSAFMSTTDFITMGRAILNSTLLSPAQTRRWLKPRIQTSSPGSSIGAPWEIRSLTINGTGRKVDYYTKAGDVGTYHAELVLVPDYQIGFTVLSAGVDSQASDIRAALTVIMINVFTPAVEQAAREEAASNYAGVYVDTASNSSVTITTNSSRLGLGIEAFRSRGVMTLDPVAEAEDLTPGYVPRLYPTTLQTISRSKTCNGTYISRTGWRAVYSAVTSTTDTTSVVDGCLAWGAVGAPIYGQRTLDDFVFELGEDGKATAIEARTWRLKMTRAST